MQISRRTDLEGQKSGDSSEQTPTGSPPALVRGRTGTSQGGAIGPDLSDALGALDADIAARLVAWEPPSGLWLDTDRNVETIKGQARLGIALTGPTTWKSVVADIWPAFQFLVWCEDTLGNSSFEIAFVPENINKWVREQQEKKSRGLRHRDRAVLRGIGRVVNPSIWPDDEKIGARPAAAAYSPDQELAFRLAATMPGRPNEVQRLAAAVLALGAGQRGSEMVLVRPIDLVELGDGRLAVEVRGPHARLVPVRQGYTDLLRRSASATSPGDALIPGHPSHAPYSALGSIQVEGLGKLSLSRARSTWLTAHLLGGTPLPHLRVMAGPLSVNTLTDLMEAAAGSVDPDEAVERGLAI